MFGGVRMSAQPRKTSEAWQPPPLLVQ
jgi:hypothetical protein